MKYYFDDIQEGIAILPKHHNEEMEETKEHHGIGYLAFKCVICGAIKYFNTYTGADITKFI